MTQKKFEKLKRGTIIKIPWSRLTLVKARVYVEGEEIDALYDGKGTVYTIESIPDNAEIIENDLLYNPTSTDFHEYENTEDWLKAMDSNVKQLDDIDQKQKEAGEMLYRSLAYPYADGKAVYQIVEVKGKKVRLMLVTGIGDDWQLPYREDGCFIDKDEAEQILNQRDVWDEMVKRTNMKTH